MRNFILLSILILISSITVAETVETPLYPGAFKISLGDYSDWNTRAAGSNCQDLGLECVLDNDKYRVVGNTTSHASSASELRELTWKLGFECLDKVAVFIDRGQHVYPDKGEYGGELFAYFLAEGNRCWNHYDGIYEKNKDEY